MKKAADYSTTIIYKITCNDPTITDKYVGHTIDFVRRKYTHSNNVKNVNSPDSHLKLYKFIRDNGGWDNWKMEIVAYYDCNNLREAKLKEQHHYVDLKATLNSVEPLKPKDDKPKICQVVLSTNKTESRFYCKSCDISCLKPIDWKRHIVTKKHIQTEQELPKTKPNFKCPDCEYECPKKSMIKRHNLSKRHKLNKEIKLSSNIPSNAVDIGTNKPLLQTETPQTDYMSIISQLFNKNNELQNFITEQAAQHKKETSKILNKMVEQSNEHRRETIEVLNRVNALNNTLSGNL